MIWKRFFSVAVALLLIASASSSSIVLAESSTEEVTIGIGDASIARGQQTRLPVTISSAPDGFSGGTLTIAAENTNIEIANFIGGNETSILSARPTKDKSKITVHVADLTQSLNSRQESVVIGYLTIRAVDNGETRVRITEGDLDNDAGEAISTTNKPGNISVISPEKTTLNVAPGPDRQQLQLFLEGVPSGVAGFNVTVSLQDSTIESGEVSDRWHPVSSANQVNRTKISLRGVDLNNSVKPTTESVVLGRINISSEPESVVVTVDRLSDDTGHRISHSVNTSLGSEGPTGDVLPGEWPMFGGGPAHTGHMKTAVPTGNITTQWKYSAGAGISAEPVISNGTIYFGTEFGAIFAVDAQTGELQWKIHPYRGRIYEALTISNGTLYTTVTHGHLLAIDSESGEVLWEVHDEGGLGYSPPVAADDTVYVGAAGDGFYAFDAQTGALRWNESFDSPRTFAVPAIDDGTLYAATWDAIIAMDSSDGSVQWRHSIEEAPVRIAVANGSVFVGTDTEWGAPRGGYAFNPQTGQEQWNNSDINTVLSPAVVDGTLYYIADSEEKLYALDTQNGQVRWNASIDSHSSPAVADGLVLIGGDDGNVSAIDAQTGQVEWRHPVSESSSGVQSPIVVDGTVYAGTWGGSMYALTDATQAEKPEIVLERIPANLSPSTTSVAITARVTSGDDLSTVDPRNVTVEFAGDNVTDNATIRDIPTGLNVTYTATALRSGENYSIKISAVDSLGHTAGTSEGFSIDQRTEEKQSVVEEYDKDSNGMDTSELLRGIGDYRSHAISVTDLLKLIDAWRTA